MVADEKSSSLVRRYCGSHLLL